MSVRGDQPRLLIYPRSGQGISGGWLGATTSNYSYVKVAVDTYKYSTLSWDRLGTGMSSHGDPIQEIQASLEVAALYALMQKLREGSINGVECKFTKVVHIGHSFGSVLTYTLAARNPEASNGLVLTGFAQNGSFIPYFALGSNFVQAETIESLKEYPHGYLAPGDEAAVEVVFFARRMFDHSILNLAYLKREPVAVGELLTIGGDLAGVSRFKGPVFVTTGNDDLPFCGGNCLATRDPTLSSIPDTSKAMFPEASDFSTFIVRNGGHGLNLEFTHPLTYRKINEYLEAHGV